MGLGPPSSTLQPPPPPPPCTWPRFEYFGYPKAALTIHPPTPSTNLVPLRCTSYLRAHHHGRCVWEWTDDRGKPNHTDTVHARELKGMSQQAVSSSFSWAAGHWLPQQGSAILQQPAAAGPCSLTNSRAPCRKMEATASAAPHPRTLIQQLLCQRLCERHDGALVKDVPGKAIIGWLLRKPCCGCCGGLRRPACWSAAVVRQPGADTTVALRSTRAPAEGTWPAAAMDPTLVVA